MGSRLTIYIANSPIIIDHHRSPTLREAIDFSIRRSIFRSPLIFKCQALYTSCMTVPVRVDYVLSLCVQGKADND